MNLTAAQTLHEYVLGKLAGEPLRKRAALYRALAQLAATPHERKNLNALALDCDALASESEELEMKHEQLVLDFQARAR